MSKKNAMGFLGPNGTHSEAAALFFQKQLHLNETLLPYPDIFSAIEDVTNGTIESCFVPVENSLEGAVHITLDTLASQGKDLVVVHEMIWGVRNFLLAKEEIPFEKIDCVFSHSQPLAQCRNFLQKNLPNAKRLEAVSTAQAAQMLDSHKNSAAIGTRRAAELYGLKILAEDIQDNNENCTRFYQVKRRSQEQNELPLSLAGHNLIICNIDGSKAGSLYAVLSEFAKQNINLTRIESRPLRTKLGRYLFFFDLEVEDNATNRENLKKSLQAIRAKSLWLEDLGQFPILNAIENFE